MKITRVTAKAIRREMGGKVWNPRTRWTHKTMVLVFVESSGGHIGLVRPR